MRGRLEKGFMSQITNLSSKSGKAKANGIELFYESFGNETDPAVVLIMGLDAQCVIWSYAFIEPIVMAGFRVIRFDNRDIGHSTWLHDWHKTKPYTLEDMALDTLGLLDFLKIEKAHFIGASMGGMIAQRISISHAERVLSLTSIMSSAFILDASLENSALRKMFLKAAPKILKYLPIKNKWTSHNTTVESYMALYKYLAGTKHSFDKEYFKALFSYSILERKGQNPKARFQQFSAIVASGSRLKELTKIHVPTLLIHGTADKLIPYFHSKKMAGLIKNAQFIEMEGIGHEIPRAELPEYHRHILGHLKKVMFIRDEHERVMAK
jgi:pimeloyl-ACP methyl ester carboxylesterase